MKKLIFLFSSLFVLSSCGDDNNPADRDDDQPQQPTVVNVKTFDKEKVAFGNGLSQSAEKTVNFPTDIDKFKAIRMYVQFDCPCNIWDVFANVLAKDKTSGEWYEIGRYITPYGRDSSPLERGLEFDVTDFKSVLNGATELKIYTEVWGSDGWLVSVDFDFEYGEPDYKYSAVVPVFQYNENSLEGVPYGEPHDFVLDKKITLPANAEDAHIRTIISGWGHATPLDVGGRGCAEWCYRTHHILIDNAPVFEHYLGPIGCGDNPIRNQQGNWQPNRAGWCPGMVVPVRINKLDNTLFGTSFNFEYQFQEWENNMQATVDNPHAYYAISTFVVVKSNEPIEKATITN